MLTTEQIQENLVLMANTIENYLINSILFFIFVLLFNSSYAFTFHNQNKLYFGQSRLRLELNSTEVEPIYIMENQNEIWKNITGYEGIYQISNLCRIRGLDRIIKRKNGQTQFYKGIVLKPHLNIHGYPCVVIHKNNVAKTYLMHRLMAIEFIPNPNNKPCINHKNGIKADNRLENLEWCTNSENAKHAYSIGLSVVSDKTKERFLILNKSRCKKVIDTKSGIVYNSTKDVSEVTGEKERTIRARLSGQNKNNTTFRYL